MMVEQWNSESGTVYLWWWNSGREVVEQWHNDSGTVEQ